MDDVQYCVAIMFVQATQSKRGQKTYVSHLVRESFRTANGPRSRTVCNISALPPVVRELIAAALSGKTCVPLEELELSRALSYGGLAVLMCPQKRVQAVLNFCYFFESARG